MSTERRFLFSLLIAALPALASPALAQTAVDDFSFLIGPYPSKGLFEFHLDCSRSARLQASATNWRLLADRDGKSIGAETHPVAADGKAHGFLDVGSMPDGANYLLTCALLDTTGKEIGRQVRSFRRAVMPFEKSPPIGEADLIVPPFTPPAIQKDSVSCWNRDYQHGEDGLLTQIFAADQPLYSRPARILAREGDGRLTPLAGDKPQLTMMGKGSISLRQTFSGADITLRIDGTFDYDGFYLFTVRLVPTRHPVAVAELRLEIPFRAAIAKLIEASVTWRRREGTQSECMGKLDPRQGVLWDSKTFPSRNWPRIGNMPPFVWIGDDDRGLVYSCASEQGMHNDENLPAAQVERVKDELIFTAWFVNSPVELESERVFQFALQASPFKAMPEHSHLWRNQTYRQPYRNGLLFTNWFTSGSYPTYGRFLTLDLLKVDASATGADLVGTMASSMSECGGAPEYQQFWHEWGSPLGWDLQKPGPPEPWAVKMLEEAKLPVNPFIRVESPSNVNETNSNYRAWWFDQEARHAGISYIYQDNPPYGYLYDPPNGYGYIRDDGRPEPTSAIWNSRRFMKRIATAAVEAGRTESPYIWANAISPVLPGRSFCRKMLNGEYLYTKLLTLDQIRVMASKQWGMELDWYPFPQTDESPYPNIGPVRKYWRAVFGRLLLHDITNFSGGDDAEFSKRWINALDLFWLDDPTVVWHPYYRPEALRGAESKTTFISTYTAKDRALLFISNQSDSGVVERIAVADLARFGSDGLKNFYDAETGEEITGDDSMKLFIPGNDYRVVLALPQPWKLSAKRALGISDLPAQSMLDPEATLTALSRQLLGSLSLQPIAGADRLYEEWIKKIVGEIQTDVPERVYLDAAACSDIDFGKKQIRCSVTRDRKRGATLIDYYNASGEDVALPARVRKLILKKVGAPDDSYVIHPVTGNSEWAFIDIAAGHGLLEICYSDATDFWGPRHGPFKSGTMMGNINDALVERQKEMGGRPVR